MLVCVVVHGFRIEGLPASRAQGPGAFYLNGTLDGSRASKFFVNVHRLDNM